MFLNIFVIYIYLFISILMDKNVINLQKYTELKKLLLNNLMVQHLQYQIFGRTIRNNVQNKSELFQLYLIFNHSYLFQLSSIVKYIPFFKQPTQNGHASIILGVHFSCEIIYLLEVAFTTLVVYHRLFVLCQPWKALVKNSPCCRPILAILSLIGN